MTYSLWAYGSMMLDHRRIDAYAAALKAALKPGDVVVELGTGTGVMAFLAREYGASKVYAIEPSDCVEVAREIQRDNGVTGIEFIRGFSQDIELPERADVLLSDMRGVVPNHGDHLRVIRDARDRFLKPGGAQLARRDHLFAALTSTEELWHDAVGLWRDAPYGIPMDAAWPRACGQWIGMAVPKEDLASPAARWCTLDYTTLTDPSFSGECTLIADRAARLTGYSFYFDTDVDDEHTLTNHPASPKLAYRSAFFPLPEVVEVKAGDEVHLTVEARFVIDEYIWRWNTRVGDRTFSQSTFDAAPLSPTILRELEGTRPVKLTDRGQAAALLLPHLEGARVDELAARLLRELPDAGFDEEGARAFVHELVERYGRFEPA